MGSTAERQLCPGVAPLQSAAGLRALPAGTEGRGARQREVRGNLWWEDGESLLGEKSSQSLTRYVSGCRANQLRFLEESLKAGTSHSLWDLSGGF